MSDTAMHENEVAIDSGLVARLIADQFPQWANLPLERVASDGTDNALYRLGDEMVVRLPRIDWAVAAVEREQHWLPQLAPSLPAAIPTPLGIGKSSEDYPWPWSVYEWLLGENPVVDRIDDPISLARELAQFIRVLRDIDTTGAPLASRGVPLSERDKQTRAAVDALHGMIDVADVLTAWKSDLDAPPWAGPLVWIHGDLSRGNILLVDGSLSAVIDFGAMGVGDPACDLIVAWNLLPTNARNFFRSELRVDDATWKRGRGLALSIALIQLPYYADRNLNLAENARHVVKEVLADHESERAG